ncbi:MAG: hypothetical protein U5O39_17275 [Gammaproteobacteria bacterium]|nr:hypothetical protein [Gammaproteobacteria bacterium]
MNDSKPAADDSSGSAVLARPAIGIWELAWPAILSNLLFSVIGIISIKIVGELGRALSRP